MSRQQQMPAGNYLQDDAIDPTLRDHGRSISAAGPSNGFSSSLVPAHFPHDEPHGQVDLEEYNHEAHPGLQDRLELRPRRANAQYARHDDANSHARSSSRQENRLQLHPHDPITHPDHLSIHDHRQQYHPLAFNRDQYPHYDELGRRRGMDHLQGSDAPGHGHYYRPQTQDYSVGTSSAQLHALQALYNHQPAIAGGEYDQTQFPLPLQHYINPNGNLNPSLMLNPLSTEAAFTVDPLYPKREKTLHDLFGLDPGVPITLDGLKDPPEGQKPEYTYPTLMKVAIWSSPRGMLTLQEIYDAIEKRFPYFKTVSNPNSWRTSIRHSLSLIAIFQKKPRPPTDPGKGSYWALDLSKGEGNKRQRKRNKRRPKSEGSSGAPAGEGKGAKSGAERAANAEEDEEDYSATDDEVCIDPSLLSQPFPNPSSQMNSQSQLGEPSNPSTSRSAHASQPSLKKPRKNSRPYPQARSSRLRGDSAGADQVGSENESNSNSSLGRRSTTTTPFDDGIGMNTNNANNLVPLDHIVLPVGRQMTGVPGYPSDRVPASLSEFGANFGASGSASSSQKAAPSKGRRNASARSSVPAPPPAPSSPPRNQPSAPQTSSSSSLNPSRVGFAAHASSRAVSFSAAAAAAAASSANANGNIQAPFGPSRDDVEIMTVGGLPIARRVSNARASRRAND